MVYHRGRRWELAPVLRGKDIDEPRDCPRSFTNCSGLFAALQWRVWSQRAFSRHLISRELAPDFLQYIGERPEMLTRKIWKFSV
jgi:hypothetical protein